jgi:hypothetical protein
MDRGQAIATSQQNATQGHPHKPRAAKARSLSGETLRATRRAKNLKHQSEHRVKSWRAKRKQNRHLVVSRCRKLKMQRGLSRRRPASHHLLPFLLLPRQHRSSGCSPSRPPSWCVPGACYRSTFTTIRLEKVLRERERECVCIYIYIYIYIFGWMT